MREDGGLRWPVHAGSTSSPRTDGGGLHERAGEGGMSGNQPPVRPELVEGCERMGACVGPMWFDRLTTNGRGRAPRAGGGGGQESNHPFVLSLSKDARGWGLALGRSLVRQAHHERTGEGSTNGRKLVLVEPVGGSGNQPPVRPELVEGCERMGACVGPFMWFDRLTTNGRGRAPRAGANHPFVLSLSKGHERAPTTRSS